MVVRLGVNWLLGSVLPKEVLKSVEMAATMFVTIACCVKAVQSVWTHGKAVFDRSTEEQRMNVPPHVQQTVRSRIANNSVY